MNSRPFRWQRNALPAELFPRWVPGLGIAPRSHVFQTRAVTTLAILASRKFYNKLNNNDTMVSPCKSIKNNYKEINSILNSWRGWQLAHMYTVFFSGHCPNSNEIDDTVQEAIKNLEKFKIIGLLSSLPKFVEDFYNIYGINLKVSNIWKKLRIFLLECQ